MCFLDLGDSCTGSIIFYLIVRLVLHLRFRNPNHKQPAALDTAADGVPAAAAGPPAARGGRGGGRLVKNRVLLRVNVMGR